MPDEKFKVITVDVITGLLRRAEKLRPSKKGERTQKKKQSALKKQ